MPVALPSFWLSFPNRHTEQSFRTFVATANRDNDARYLWTSCVSRGCLQVRLLAHMCVRTVRSE